MAGMMVESYVLTAIQNGLAAIKSNTSILDDVLNALSSDELSSAKNYFATAAITVAPGFPMEQTKMPFIGVTVADESQFVEETPIGLAYERTDNGDGTWTDVLGARFRGTIKTTVYTENADLVVWLSAICSWALLSNYSYFIATAGMNNLATGLGDYEPSPQWLPTFVFARGVFLSGDYDKTFTASPNVVTTWDTTPTFEDITTLDG